MDGIALPEPFGPMTPVGESSLGDLDSSFGCRTSAAQGVVLTFVF